MGSIPWWGVLIIAVVAVAVLVVIVMLLFFASAWRGIRREMKDDRPPGLGGRIVPRPKDYPRSNNRWS